MQIELLQQSGLTLLHIHRMLQPQPLWLVSATTEQLQQTMGSLKELLGTNCQLPDLLSKHPQLMSQLPEDMRTQLR